MLQNIGLMNIPTDYTSGYEKARILDPELADKYIAHTTIGDPEADALMEQVSSLGAQETGRILTAGMNRNYEALRDEPSSARDFFKSLETAPDWLDYSAFPAGMRMFHRNSRLALGGLLAGVLIEGFSTNISRSFMIPDGCAIRASGA